MIFTDPEILKSQISDVINNINELENHEGGYMVDLNDVKNSWKIG